MWNWLFGGPKQEAQGPHAIVLRSLRLDLDAVTDAYKMIADHSGPTRLMVYPPPEQSGPGGYQPREVAIDEIDGLPEAQLRRLRIESDGDPRLGVEFRERTQPHVSFSEGPAEQVGKQIVQMLLESGTPRIRWSVFLPFVPIATFAGVAGLGFLSLIRFGPWSQNAIVVPFVLLVAFLSFREVQRGLDLPRRPGPGRRQLSYPGHRVLPRRRKDERARQAARREQLKAASVTIPVAAILGAAAQAWFGG